MNPAQTSMQVFLIIAICYITYATVRLILKHRIKMILIKEKVEDEKTKILLNEYNPNVKNISYAKNNVMFCFLILFPLSLTQVATTKED